MGVKTVGVAKDDGVRLRDHYELYALIGIFGPGLLLTAGGLICVLFFGALRADSPLALEIVATLLLICGTAAIAASLISAVLVRKEVREDWKEWRKCCRKAREKRMDDIYGALGR